MNDGPHVLIVEDEALFAVMMANHLAKEYKCVCHQASTGEDAIRLAKEKDHHLIFMDIRLAGKMDGIEAARQIRENSTVPIIFMTAYSCSATREKAQSLHLSEYITKPVNMMTVHSLVQKYTPQK